jgi:hypothetical protein
MVLGFETIQGALIVANMVQKLRVLIYAVGIRPRFWSYFYDSRLEMQEQWRTGKK